jgi:16S rRNA (cytosine1407-C5)-methyltransferase
MKLLGVVPPFLTLCNLDGAVLCERYPNYFDKILLDAPCSAEARFVASNYKSYGYWDLKQVNKMAAAQKKLLLAAWTALKPGGTLVYSTCTMSPEENELQMEVLKDTVGNEAVFEEAKLPNIRCAPAVLSWGGKKVSAEISKTARIYPTTEIEPFFVAKVRKI